ncbi:MAG: hypothetical protein P8Y58_17020, partial [Novosphingobium sp.]
MAMAPGSTETLEVFSDLATLPLYARGAVILLGSFDGLHRGLKYSSKPGAPPAPMPSSRGAMRPSIRHGWKRRARAGG